MENKNYGFFGSLKAELLDEVLGDVQLANEDEIFAEQAVGDPGAKQQYN